MNNDMKYLVTKDKKYPFIYSLNVMSAIQSKYGSLDDWANLIEPKEGKKEPNIEALLFFFKEAINEGIDIENEKLKEPVAFVNEKQVGRIISEVGIEEAGKQLKDAVVVASGNNDKEDKFNNQEKN